MLKDYMRRTSKGKQMKWAGMFLQCLTVNVTLWLCSFLCFHRCLLLVVLGRSESIRLSDMRKEVDSPRHHLPRVRSALMSHSVWLLIQQEHRVYILHPNFCILVIRVINQICYPISWETLRKQCRPRSHNVLRDALGNMHRMRFLYISTL